MTLWKWSRTAATNATADSTCPFPEGMAPSAVNDGVRGAMAAVAKYRDDIAGAIVTAGTSTAYTMFSYQGYDTLAHMDGAMIAFAPHATNGATVTINVDGLGAKPLRSAPSVELLAAMLIQSSVYAATYNNATSEWILHGIFGNPYNVPLLGCIDYFGTSAPNSTFVFPQGQALSRTTYAAAFAIMGTTYGSGDGSTTFNVPDLTGRVTAMKEASATRLTPTYFGGNSANLGAVGGSESAALTTQAQLPSGVTLTSSAQNITVWARQNTGTSNVSGTTIVLDLLSTGNPGGGASSATYAVGGQTSSLGGSSGGHNNTQPTFISNKIMRVI